MFTCRKLKLKAVTPYMSNLPTFPMDYQSPPFTNTGLDFFGPMFIKQQRSRLKRWGCLFASMVTQAVHLELVESLDRLIYKCPAEIHQKKRQTQYTGARLWIQFQRATRELNFGHPKLNLDKITNFTDHQIIKWKFNPPSSPHMGGAWERLVRVVKLSLLHIIKDRILRLSNDDCVH